jgi:hypothetical protein
VYSPPTYPFSISYSVPSFLALSNFPFLFLCLSFIPPRSVREFSIVCDIKLFVKGISHLALGVSFVSHLVEVLLLFYFLLFFCFMDRHSREGPGSYGYIVIKMDKRERERYQRRGTNRLRILKKSTTDMQPSSSSHNQSVDI